MKRSSSILAVAALVMLSLAPLGCSDTSKSTRETTVKTPGGTTTTTETRQVDKSGENPPPATR